MSEEKKVTPLYSTQFGESVNLDQGESPSIVEHIPAPETDQPAYMEGSPEEPEERDTTVVSRQLSPLVKEGAEIIRKGIEKSNKDIIAGLVIGVAGLLALQSIFRDDEGY
jgi:hypothetical protein